MKTCFLRSLGLGCFGEISWCVSGCMFWKVLGRDRWARATALAGEVLEVGCFWGWLLGCGY